MTMQTQRFTGASKVPKYDYGPYGGAPYIIGYEDAPVAPVKVNNNVFSTNADPFGPQTQSGPKVNNNGGVVGPYDKFQEVAIQKLGRPLTQEELNSNEFLYQLSNELVRLLPVDRLASFSSQRLMSLDNADLFALAMHNPNIINQMPGYRFTGGNGYGGLHSDQLNQLIKKAGSQGIGGPGISEISAVYQKVTGQAPGGGQSGDDAQLTLDREKFYADLANQPGNFYNYAFRSRGTTPPVLQNQQAAQNQQGGVQPVTGALQGNGGATTSPGFYTGAIGANQNPYGEGPFGERPDFSRLRQQVQDVGGDIPPGLLNPILGQEIPTYRSQGGVPFFAPQTLAKMTPSERQLLGTTVNRTGGRAEDFFERSNQLGRMASRAPSIGYAGAARLGGR